MVLGIKPYKIYMDEDGFSFSCRVRACAEGETGHTDRAAAETAAKDHHDKKHIERDEELENWITGLCGDESQ